MLGCLSLSGSGYQGGKDERFLQGTKPGEQVECRARENVVGISTRASVLCLGLLLAQLVVLLAPAGAVEEEAVDQHPSSSGEVTSGKSAILVTSFAQTTESSTQPLCARVI